MLEYYILVFLFSCVNCKYFDLADHPSCYAQNKSCSGFFNNYFSLDFCQQMHYGPNNSSICDAIYNETIIHNNKNIDLGVLILKPFAGELRTIFNITFVDIKFQKLFIHFQEYKNSTNIVPNRCNARIMKFISNVEQSSFSYVCPWTDGTFHGNEVEFHYQYGRKEFETFKKVRYKVPENEILQNKSMKYFLYIDFTDKSNLILNIVPLFDFNITEFNITVLHKYDNITTVKSSQNVFGYSYSYQTHSNDGEYLFRVQPILENCDENLCEIQDSVIIVIKSKSSSLLIIGMVGVSILIPVFLIIVYMWTGKCFYKLKQYPNVLLVTVPTNDAHDYVAPAFAEFLKQLNINIILDVNENIPGPDLTDWLKVQLNKVTHIIYLRSRDDINDKRIVHKYLYEATVFYHEPQFSTKKRECIINFPYSFPTYPQKLAHVNEIFEFKKDLNRIFKFLIGKKIIGGLKNELYENLMLQIDLVQNLPPVVKKEDNLEKIIVIKDNNDEDESYMCRRNYEKKQQLDEKDNISLGSSIKLFGEAQSDNEEKKSIISDFDENEYNPF